MHSLNSLAECMLALTDQPSGWMQTFPLDSTHAVGLRHYNLAQDLEVSSGDGDAVGGEVHSPGVGNVVSKVVQGSLTGDVVLGHVSCEGNHREAAIGNLLHKHKPSQQDSVPPNFTLHEHSTWGLMKCLHALLSDNE
jgi:hypothetical protein